MAGDSDRFHLAALAQCVGRREAARHGVQQARNAWRQLPRGQRRIGPEDIERQCRRHDLTILLPGDRAFPGLLQDVADPPALLYARGDVAVLLRPAVAVVGARRCSRAGAEVAARLAGDLAARGVVVVSGLARGIDSAAHRAALRDGVTVAVVGSGLGRPYPAGNRGLVRAMVEGGSLLLSEYAPLSGARRHHFPERNRLISGLVRAVVVVEAGEHSGSLITARLAAEQGREVCAVPGSVQNPATRGCHRLLRQGASLVECADDVLEAAGLVHSPWLQEPAAAARVAAPGALTPGLAVLLDAVEASVTTLDQVIGATGLSGEAAAAALVELELGGFVRQVPGGYIRRPRSRC